jgi:hydrogenase maturation protease
LSATENATLRTLIIGVGNALRRDDGVGPAVIRRLTELLPRGATAIEHSGDGADLMEVWQGAARVFLVDATSSGAAAGTVQRFDANKTELPHGLFRYSSHLFGVAEAVETARALHRLPSQLVVYGIEGTVFEYGEGLSPAVAAVVRQVATAILTELTD